MTDDEIKVQQAVDRTLASINAASESYIGAPVTREMAEAASSKALGFPVRFPDWDEATGTATKCEVEPPIALDYMVTPYNMLPDNEPRVEYFREQDPQTLETFYGVWEAAGRPLVRVGWRDPGGGWVRWLWFPHEGKNHALFLPAYMGAGRSEAQTLLLKSLSEGVHPERGG